QTVDRNLDEPHVRAIGDLRDLGGDPQAVAAVEPERLHPIRLENGSRADREEIRTFTLESHDPRSRPAQDHQFEQSTGDANARFPGDLGRFEVEPGHAESLQSWARAAAGS